MIDTDTTLVNMTMIINGKARQLIIKDDEFFLASPNLKISGDDTLIIAEYL